MLRNLAMLAIVAATPLSAWDKDTTFKPFGDKTQGPQGIIIASADEKKVMTLFPDRYGVSTPGAYFNGRPKALAVSGLPAFTLTVGTATLDGLGPAEVRNHYPASSLWHLGEVEGWIKNFLWNLQSFLDSTGKVETVKVPKGAWAFSDARNAGSDAGMTVTFGTKSPAATFSFRLDGWKVQLPGSKAFGMHLPKSGNGMLGQTKVRALVPDEPSQELSKLLTDHEDKAAFSALRAWAQQMVAVLEAARDSTEVLRGSDKEGQKGKEERKG